MIGNASSGSIAQSPPVVNLEDGAHKDPISDEWVVVYHGDEVAWGTEAEARRSYDEVTSTNFDYARKITFTPFSGSMVDWAVCPDCGTVVNDGTMCPDCHILVLSEVL